ncbi:hypothetical protein IEO21_00471 [Rhodonia placenta]|uniref:Sterol regulatory element-binding protein cleavage-activating protein n=1 Tax=Rhodonia placenta TaxID=104341 RepID=A0A8H7PBF0_9APHY|nr:hypothetical protein IEO21_00471 [Postia placenta]
MYSLPTPAVLQRTREYGTRFFHRFGIHCATHQIRLILVSSVVITSLLFPAIAVYSSPETRFFAGFTLRVLDSFSTSDDLSRYFDHHDLRNLWEGHSTLRIREDSVARAQCGVQGILRSERVLVGSISPDYGLEAVEPGTLASALKLEKRLSGLITSRGLPCVKTSAGSCFSLSPSVFWDHSEESILADDNVLETVNSARNVSSAGISINPEILLAGRELRDPTGPHIDGAMFLALTYFFRDRDCLDNTGHFQWLRVLEAAAGHAGDLVVQAQAPKLVALEYDKNVSTRSRITILSAFCYAAYLTFFVYCAQSMRRMVTVHSRFGLALTGLVELLVSTITSLSVCALVGFRMTMVPWELFPIIVIFIGVENMFHIVDAVLKTPVTVPVKERIAQGLSQAGTSNTLKVVSYNAVLGVIAFFSTGAIRQFCAFSIVVLVAHWFLVHTFFVTVLSIDIQRLELDELLRQDSLGPSDSSKPATATKVLPPPRTWSQAITATQNAIKGRPAKNISFFLLLAITATLYFATSPVSVPYREDTRSAYQRHLLANVHKISSADRISPAFRIWQMLNPSDDALIHIRVESPTILVLAPEEDADTNPVPVIDQEKAFRPRVSRLGRLWNRLFRHVWWLTKYMVLPITATTVLLYGLLLYLLKNVELLETQRQRPGPDHDSSDESSSVEGEVSFTTLPRAFPTDVDAIASSKDGKVVATLGLQNEVVVWRTTTRAYMTVDTSNILLSSASTPTAATTLTTLAVHPSGTVCAAGTGSGVIGVWTIYQDQAKRLTELTISDHTSGAGVAALYFAQPQLRPPSPMRPLTPSPSPSDRRSSQSPIILYATYDNGSVVRWEVEADSKCSARYVAPTRSGSVVKSMLLPVHGDDRLLVGFSLDDGTFELCDINRPDQLIAKECWIAAGNPQDLVCAIDVCNLQLDGKRYIVICAATQAGVVSLWDAGTRDCLFIMDEPFGEVNQLRVTAVPLTSCLVCGELPCENFLVSFSVGQVILFFRAYLYLPTRRCSCPRNQPQNSLLSSSLGHRSRSGSMASIASSNGSNTPKRARSRNPSISSISSTSSALEAPMFPVSAHGVHSRRASEKESMRRTHDTFFINSDCDDADPRPLGPVDVNPIAGFLSVHPPTSIWQSLIVVRVADAMFERGSWDVVGHRVVGIRRKARPQFVQRRNDHKVELKVESPHGLSASTLERWELWTFDPDDSRLQASPLSAINRDVHERGINKRRRGMSVTESSKGQASPTTKRTQLIPRLHFTRVTPFVGSSTMCMAGFGNTVGLFDFGLLSNARRRRLSLVDDTRKKSNTD